MKTALFYDTETTGLPLFKEPSEHPDQPHIVQLAALLVDLDTRKVLSTLDLIVQPDGWVIPDEIAAIHGITTQKAQSLGVSEELATQLLLELNNKADLRVAHNEQFDARIVRIAVKRHIDGPAGDLDVIASDYWKAGAAECTVRMSTPICKLPPTAKMRGGNKAPTLAEAYRHFFGKDFTDQHTALADATACMQVYFAIQDQKH